jgi:hypothetical protein
VREAPLELPMYLGVRIVLTKNLNKNTGFVNGMGATVLGMDRGNLIVRTEQGRRIAMHEWTAPDGVVHFPLRLGYASTLHNKSEKDPQNEPPERPKSLPGGARGTQNRSREAPGAAPGRPGPPGVGVSAPRAPPEAEKGAQKDPEKSPREGPGKSRGLQKGRAGQKTVRAQRFRTLKIATAFWDRFSVNDWSILDLRTLRIVWQGYTMLHFSTFRKGRRK